MSYGNCCLVSDIAECTEVVEDKAVIFRKSDVDDLRDKLQSLCDDEQKVQDYKSQSADFIFSKCSWDDVVEKTLELYKNKNIMIRAKFLHFYMINLILVIEREK